MAVEMAKTYEMASTTMIECTAFDRLLESSAMTSHTIAKGTMSMKGMVVATHHRSE